MTGQVDWRDRRRLRVALVALLLASTLVGVVDHGLWAPNETRGAEMVREMLREGRWLAPLEDGRPFLEKPPLLYWTAAALAKLSGGLTPTLARVPAALYALGTLALLWLLVVGGEDGADREAAAWAAVFMCATAAEFAQYARVVLTDMALTFAVTLALTLFWFAYRRSRPAFWLAFLLAAAGSFYAKGLIGPALVWAAVAPTLVLRRRFRLLAGLGAAFVLVLAAVVLPWVVLLGRNLGPDAVRWVFWDNQVGRFLQFTDPALAHDPFFVHKQPWHYYLRTLPLYLMPWTPLVIAAGAHMLRRRPPRDAFDSFLLTASAGMLGLLEFSSAKVAVYALPVYPLVFAATGLWLAGTVRRERLSRLERLASWATVAAVSVIVTGIGLALTAGPFLFPAAFPPSPPAWTVGRSAVAAALVMVASGLVAHLPRMRTPPPRPRALTLAPAGVAAVMMMLAALAVPVMDYSRSFEPLAGLVASQASAGRAVAADFTSFDDLAALDFYLDRRLPELPGIKATAAFLAGGPRRAAVVVATDVPAIRKALAGRATTQLLVGRTGCVTRRYAVLLNDAPALAARNLPGSRGDISSAPGAGPRRADARHLGATVRRSAS